MASQIDPILVKDDILMTTDVLTYAVQKGGANVSVQRFPATSTSSTSHVYQINLPSTSVVLDRHLLWHSEIEFDVTCPTPATGETPVQWGKNTVCAPFPLHQLVQNMSCQINNTTVSSTTNQILDPILRCLDKKALARYNSTTAVYLDNYGKYSTIGAADNNPFAGYDKAVDPEYNPRGCVVCTVVSGNAANGTTATIKFSVTEPIMLSPFLYGEQEHKSAGIYGINNINFTMALDSQGKRALRRLDATGFSVGAIRYNDSYIECRFLTPHPSDLLPETNIVAYQEFTNYLKAEGNIANGAAATITSNNIQLSSIPDKVIVWVRPKQGNLSYASPDAYASIESVSVLFNNQSGLLSSASKVELFNMAQEAGLKEGWLAYNGVSSRTDAVTGLFTQIATSGTPLVLNFGEHISISEDFYSAGSIGSFNFQITVVARNNLGDAFDAELNVMFLQSGAFVTASGVSSKYLGLLSKQQVLEASLQEPMAKSEMARLVGGGFFSRLLEGAKKVGRVVKGVADVVATPLRKGLSYIDHPIAQAASQGLKAVGYGMSGGARSGGRRVTKHIM
jgi:hypothetical protein